MRNYFEFNDKVAFHPGYYIKEIVDESGLTQEDFAKRLGTTPKNLSILIRGEQSLSIEMASKLSRMLGTSVGYWLGLQQAYNEMYAEFLMAEDLKHEKEIFKLIDYKVFQRSFRLAFPTPQDRRADQLYQGFFVRGIADSLGRTESCSQFQKL